MGGKPVIGVTKPDHEDLFEFVAICAAVIWAGGKPKILTPSTENYESAEIDGLVLGGGKDIFPGLYQADPDTDYVYDKARDEMEVYWAERARDDRIPALGICRGAQLMNVACGGSLHYSVAEFYEDAHYPDGLLHNIFYRKRINIYKNSLLNKITKRTELKVNSIHKQAIDRLGNGLQINAAENNGVVQAVAHETHPFFLGVQFHPEFLTYRLVFRRIFKALINAARTRIAGKDQPQTGDNDAR